jgi:two-component system OmpR family response regulator
MNILYLEDNLRDATLVERYIRTTNHELIIVTSIAEAREKISEDLDLVLLDILIDTKRSGMNFAQELRRGGFSQPIVGVTALATSTDMDAYAALGFDRILVKPFMIGELAEIINHYT